MAAVCNPDVPDCDHEICGNGLDDDCDGLADCADADCSGAGKFEICFDGLDNDCDPATLDTAPATDVAYADAVNNCFMPYDEPPDSGGGAGGSNDEHPTEEDCDKCGKCEGEPVNLMNQQVFIGPHEDLRIASPQGGAFDLVFSRTWDSKRAQQDDVDDKRPSVDRQRPWERVLGPGWRHSYEVRLILENVDVLGRPSSVTFDHPARRVRMHATDLVNGRYGRVPGHAINAQRSGAMWTVLDDDGTVYEFQEETGIGTELHPWGVINPNETDPKLSLVYAARLRTIIPGGQPNFRIRLYHEEDLATNDLGCAGVVGAASTCSASRGLLAVVAQEWLDGSVWRRGSSIVLRYGQTSSAPPSTKRQLILQRVEEGADYDDGASDATDLAAYGYTVDLGWRSLPQNVFSCVDRTSGATDASAGPCSEPASMRWLYEPAAIPGVESQHLVAVVNDYMPTAANSFDSQPSEQHDWDLVNGVFRAQTHRSAQLVLSQVNQSASPNGIRDWTRNGVLRRTEFLRGRPVLTTKCDASGGNCVTLSRRDFAPSTENNTYTLGLRSLQNSDGVTTIKQRDENGNTLVEAEVIASPGTSPIVCLGAISGTTCVAGDNTLVVFSGVSAVRRVTRNYFSDDGTLQRASATLSITHQPSVASTTSPAAVRRFPASLASTNWSPAGAVSTRQVPNNSVSVAGAPWFYDVVATDYDGAGTIGTINETGDRVPVWNHTVETGVGGVMLYRSSRATIDSFGRTTVQESFAAPRAAASNVTPTKISRDEIAYEGVTSTVSARNRGRKKQVTSYQTVTNTTQTGGRVTWVTCTPNATFSPYSEYGEVECFDVPQSPTNFRTQIVTTSRNGDPAQPRQRVTSQTGLPSTFEDLTSSGSVIASGVVGGNHQKVTYPSTDAVTSHSVFTRVENAGTTSSPTLLSSTTFGFDTNGYVNAEESRDASATLRRKRESSYDDAGRQLIRKQYTTGASPLTNTSTVDAASGRVTQIVEPDGNVETRVFDATGIDAGRLRRIERRANLAASPVVIREFAYDAWGRTTGVWNGSAATGELATVLTPEGQGVFREVLSGVATSTEGLTREHFSSVVGNNVVEIEVTRSSTTGAQVRASRLTRDALGRPTALCPVNAATLICSGSATVQWFYDSKPAAMAVNIVPTVYKTGEPPLDSGRTIAITQTTNQTGRLSYVIHPGGVTLYEYDTAGRVLNFVQHEGALVGSALTPSLTRVWTTTYTATGEVASIRYPSGHKVENVFSLDKRAPTEVYIRTSADGLTNVNRLVSNVALDVDGAVIGWEWGNGFVPTLKHTIARDQSGRVTSIVDENTGDATKKAELRYNYNNPSQDEDPTSIEDRGPYASILRTSGTGIVVSSLTKDPTRDLLRNWLDPDNTNHTLNVEPTPPATAQARVSDYVAPFTSTYQRTREQLTARGTSPVLTYSATDGHVVSATGPSAFSAATVGLRGELTGYTVGASAWTMGSDDLMNRWFLTQGTLIDSRFRYGPGNVLTDYFRWKSSGQWSRDEYIYLLGMPIGVTHEDNQFALVTYWLSPDAMGTPRRAFVRNLGFSQIRRVVMNPWGKAVVTDDRGTTPTSGLPKLPFRLPGQLQDEAPGVLAGDPSIVESIVDNKYRAYFPEFGIYLQPDPSHQMSVMRGSGGQAYSYVGGQPLRNADVDGRYYLDQTWDQLPKGASRKESVQTAWNVMSNSIRCKCAFKVYKKSIKFNDNLPTSITTQYDNNPAVNASSDSTGIRMTASGCNGPLCKVASTLGHEVTHSSFGASAADDANKGLAGGPYDIGAWCGCTGQRLEPGNKKIAKCIECRADCGVQ